MAITAGSAARGKRQGKGKKLKMETPRGRRTSELVHRDVSAPSSHCGTWYTFDAVERARFLFDRNLVAAREKHAFHFISLPPTLRLLFAFSVRTSDSVLLADLNDKKTCMVCSAKGRQRCPEGIKCELVKLE